MNLFRHRRLRREAESKDLQLRYERPHVDRDAADHALLDQLADLGVDLTCPLVVEVGLSFPEARGASAAATALSAQGFRCRENGGGVLVEHMTTLTVRTVQSLEALLGELADEHGGWSDGWRAAVPPPPATDPVEQVVLAERLVHSDLLGARTVLQSLLPVTQVQSSAAAAAMLALVLADIGDGRGFDVVRDWTLRRGDVWGSFGLFTAAVCTRDLTDDDPQVSLGLSRPLFERALAIDTGKWRLACQFELARALANAGDRESAGMLLADVISAGHPKISPKAQALADELMRAGSPPS